MYPYQRIIAIDPGVTIGLASITHNQTIPESFSWSAHQTDQVEKAFDWVDREFIPSSTLVIEDFISAGHLTKEAKCTIKVIGLFEYFYEISQAVELVVPQKRKPLVAQARAMIGQRGIEGPHSGDALAHAIAKLRRLGVQSPVFN